MANRNFLQNPAIADGAITPGIQFPCVSEAPADGRMSLAQIVAEARKDVTIGMLTPPGWLTEFVNGGGYEGGEADARAALGVDPAGTAAVAVAPVAAALTDLVTSLHPVAFSGSLSDLSMPELQEQMLLAATPAEVRTAIGAAAIGGSGFTWRNVTGVADSDTIVVANTDTGVVIIDGGFSRLYFEMPEGVEDGQEIVIAITGSIDVVIWLGAGTVIQNHPHFNEAGGAGYTLKWIDAASSWIVLG